MSDYHQFGEPSGAGFIDTHFDFARCQRADGSFYGTGGVCRKGTPTEAKQKEAKAADKAAKAADKKAAAADKAWRKAGMPKGDQQKEVRRLDKEAKALNKAAEKADKEFQKVSKSEAKAKATSTQTAGKAARREMIAARDKEKELRAARKTAEAGSDKKAAAAARKAHIASKKEAKAAVEKFQSGQAKGGDNRRFGRDSERSSATTRQLQNALSDKRVSPRARAAIEREISMRNAK